MEPSSTTPPDVFSTHPLLKYDGLGLFRFDLIYMGSHPGAVVGTDVVCISGKSTAVLRKSWIVIRSESL